MGSEAARRSDATGGRLPTFLIIGTPKSGTTSLASYLSQHPEVFVSAEKELHFFDNRFDRGVDWYRSNFAGSAGARAVGEASPTYYMHADAIERMAGAVPDARLIALLRNPIDAAWSNYWMQRSLGFERRSFADAVLDELDDRPMGRAVRYLGSGRYLEHLRRVGERYPRDALLVKVFEDLRDTPGGTFAEVCRHIGVDVTFAPETIGEVVNPSTRLRSEGLRRFMLKHHAWKRLPFRLAMAIDRLNRVEARYPSMDPAMRSRLAAWFAEPNAALGEWLGRDLSGWR
jgi:Sulfotransferase domain